MTDLFSGIASETDAIAYEVDADAIAWLTFDRPGAKQNVLSSGVMKRLDELIARIRDDAAAGRVRSVVIRSGKPGTFIAGADVNEIGAITDPSEGTQKARAGQEVFNHLAALPVPTVAAVDGVCLGGGTELILACTYRIASDRKETKIGLPEVQLGILPAFGGSTRLPRLVGMRTTLEMILTSRNLDARKAERAGLVDERVHPAILEKRAREVAKSLPGKGQAPRAAKGGLPGKLMESAPGRKLMLNRARKGVMEQTHGKYPAPLAALDVLGKTLSVSVEESLALEAEALGRLIVTPVSKNLVHVFHLTEAAKKAAPAAAPLPVESVGVIGAGVMGGGIAQIVAYRGIKVRLKDIKPEAVGLGLRHAWEAFDGLVKRKRIQSVREAKQMMDRISPTLDYSGFRLMDVVVEAVVEKMEVKKAVLKETEAATRDDCILTTNTSSLSVTEMQSALQRPERVCGMHFFNPVNRMPLVEVIRGARSSDESISTIFALARRLEKTPVIVRDGPGFLVNRILAPYLNEAGYLLGEGARIEQVDRALVDFGMPMGPFRLLDEIGLDVARHAAAAMYEAFGERLRPAPVMVALGSTDRLGKKNSRGFYRYEGGKEQEVDPTVYGQLGVNERKSFTDQVIVERCVYAMVNEAARILEDGIVDGPGDVDLGMIMGTGFPPYRGGLLRYADSVGTRAILQRLEALAREVGPRFEPAPLQRRYSESGRGFYA